MRARRRTAGGARDTLDRPWLRAIAVAGAAGVALYIAAWLVSGALWDGYDPARQAISELFATDAPATSARLLTVVLLLTGILLIAFGWMLHEVMPGGGAAGPVAVALSGVATALVPLVPCSPGCPGAGTTTVDTWHTVLAGGGYLALALAPLLFAARLWRPHRGLAVTSLAFGFAACAGFAAYALGLGGELGGAVQRVFNTTADVWLVVMAIAALRRLRAQTDGSTSSNPAPDPGLGS